ncbi:zinc finger protein 862-like [Paramisgurnus dabryanus]|uniref:zinc finger protein 862-like n=1 Tax=Paramisgurnus dabryanus TaxID=90735 RepID=UPI003CCF2E83
MLTVKCHCVCRVDEKKGLAVGKTYRNANQAQVFMHYIAEIERRKVKEEISATKFISIMVDGSTDSSVMEEELVYTRMSRAGKVKVQFVGIQALKKADAAHITDAICSQMSAISGGEDWKGKLVACGTDGAAVMTGSKTGVVSRLRGERTYILGVHCMAHRLELAFKDVMKTNNLCRKVEDLLTGLFTFYHRSPLNRAKLKDSFSVLGIKPLMPTRIGGTRWVCHLLRALDHFLRGFKGIVQHLEQMQSPDDEGVNAAQQSKARGFYKLMTDGDVLKFSSFLHDTLTHLSNLSLKLQQSCLTVADVHSCLTSTQAVILKYKYRPGPMLRKVLDSNTYQGVNLRPSDTSHMMANKDKLLDKLSDSMDNRFGDVGSGILNDSKIVSFQQWPDPENSAC